MPCPFAPLLGFFPALLALPFYLRNRVARKLEQGKARFREELSDLAEGTVTKLGDSSELVLELHHEQLESLEFYSGQIPDFRKRQALQVEEHEGFGFMLFNKESSLDYARQISKLLAQAEVKAARVSGSNIRLKLDKGSNAQATKLKELIDYLKQHGRDSGQQLTSKAL